jgi:hypothetical protein
VLLQNLLGVQNHPSRIRFAGSLKTYLGSSYLAPATESSVFDIGLAQQDGKQSRENVCVCVVVGGGKFLLTSLVVAERHVRVRDDDSSTVHDGLGKG